MKPCKPLQTDTPNFLLVQKPCQGLISCETDRGCSAPSDRIEDAYTSDRSWTVGFLIQSRNWARSQSAILVRPSACGRNPSHVVWSDGLLDRPNRESNSLPGEPFGLEKQGRRPLESFGLKKGIWPRKWIWPRENVKTRNSTPGSVKIMKNVKFHTPECENAKNLKIHICKRENHQNPHQRS